MYFASFGLLFAVIKVYLLPLSFFAGTVLLSIDRSFASINPRFVVEDRSSLVRIPPCNGLDIPHEIEGEKGENNKSSGPEGIRNPDPRHVKAVS